MDVVTNKRQCVLFDGTSLGRRMKGVGRYAYQMLIGLERELGDVIEIRVLVFAQPLPKFPEEFRVVWHRVPYASELILGVFHLERLVRECRAVALIRPAEKIGRRYSAPTLTVCHDINPLIWRVQSRLPWYRRLLELFWEQLRGDALRCSERVICNSEYIQKAAITHFGLEIGKTTVGFCGVDCRFPELAARSDRHSVRQHYGGKGFLLAFATGDDREGAQILPELFQACRQHGYPGHLVVAGTRPEAVYVEKLRIDFKKRGCDDLVHWLPFLGEDQTDTLAGLYGAADFYLETSRHEGFGMQLAEAMACGAVCFSSGCGALEEISGGHALPLAITQPGKAGAAVAAAWHRSEHRRDTANQRAFVSRYDWRRPQEIVVNFVRAALMSKLK